MKRTASSSADAIVSVGGRRTSPIVAAGDRRRADAASAWFVGRRSPETRRAYASDLAHLGRFLLEQPHAAAELAHVAAAAAAAADIPRWRDAMMAENAAPATIARRLSAARAFFRFLQRGGYRTDDPAAGVEVPRVCPELQYAPSVEASDMRALLRSATSGRFAPRAVRNRAALRLLGSIGLRCLELCSLRVSDFNAAASTVRVRGKGGKVRTLDTGKELAGELLELCREQQTDARIFPLSTRRVRQLVESWGRHAGVDVAPHALRRTFATVYLDRGGSLETLRRSLGHSDPRTTARYDRRREASAIVSYD